MIVAESVCDNPSDGSPSVSTTVELFDTKTRLSAKVVLTNQRKRNIVNGLKPYPDWDKRIAEFLMSEDIDG